MAIPVAVLLYGRTGIVTIPDVRVYEGEEHIADRTITRYPVESGSELVDHAIREPMQLVLRGFVSSSRGSGKSPEQFPGAVPGAAAPGPILNTGGAVSGELLPRSVWGQFLELLDGQDTVTITTNLGRYQNMALERVQTQLNATTGENLVFEARFREVQYASALAGLDEQVMAEDGVAADRGATQEGGQVAATAVSTAQPGSVSDFALGFTEGLSAEDRLTPIAAELLRECYEGGEIPLIANRLSIPNKSSNDTRFSVQLEGFDVRIRLRWVPGPPIGYWTISLDVGSRKLLSERTMIACERIMGPGNSSGLSGDFYAIRVRSAAAGTTVDQTTALISGDERVLPRFAWGLTAAGRGDYELYYVPDAETAGLGLAALLGGRS